MILTLIQLFRVKQWNKNLFVFAALIFSRKLFQWPDILSSLAGFGLFSLAASAVYIVNDILDLESDKQHPRKKTRPLASGLISVRAASLISAMLGAGSVLVAFILNKGFGSMLAVYILINLFYSIALKHMVIIDVMVIAAGFVLRVLAGAAVISVLPSSWLVICTVLLALFLAFGKRRHEIIVMGGDAESHREVLEHYSTYFLDQMMAVVTASTVMSYMLYTVSEETFRTFGTKRLLWTTPFVLYGIFRYLYLVHQKEKGGDPASLMFSDKPLLINLILWVIACVSIIYFVG
ncbi:MAG: decaprenyl-phosphate phosphoribosyltransferase [Candidatus Brocadiia bacterium]